MADTTRADGFHLDDDTCVDLAAGLIGDDEAARLLDHAAGCPECEERLRRAVAGFESVRAAGAPARGAGGARRLPTAPARRRFVGSQRALGVVVAALVVVVAAVLWMAGPFHRAGHNAIVYWLPAASEFRSLRSAAGADSAFWSGLDAYDARNTAEAARQLRSAQTSGAYEDLRQIYLASALSLTGHHADALTVLDSVAPDALPDQWRARALWIRYVCLDALDRDAQARMLLRELAALPGPIGDRARAASDHRP